MLALLAYVPTLLPSQAMAQLQHQGTYSLVLTSTSHAGISSSLATTFTADATPPVVGEILDGGGGLASACLIPGEPVRVAWRGLADDVSGLSAVTWGLGTNPYETDVEAPRPVTAHEQGSVELAGVNLTALAAGTTLFSVLKVTNGAGANTTVVSEGLKLVAAGGGSAKDVAVCL